MGGLGCDIFVLYEVDGEVRIFDFNFGQDWLDLSFFVGLCNSGQLGFIIILIGVILIYQDMVICLILFVGGGFEIDDVFWDGFYVVDCVDLGDVIFDGVIFGSGNVDVLSGISLVDEI